MPEESSIQVQDGRWACEQCGEGFPTYYAAARHERDEHDFYANR